MRLGAVAQWPLVDDQTAPGLPDAPDDGFGVQRRDGPRVDDLRVDALLGDPLVLGDEDLDELIAGFEEYRESPDE